MYDGGYVFWRRKHTARAFVYRSRRRAAAAAAAAGAERRPSAEAAAAVAVRWRDGRRRGEFDYNYWQAQRAARRV